MYVKPPKKALFDYFTNKKTESLIASLRDSTLKRKLIGKFVRIFKMKNQV